MAPFSVPQAQPKPEDARGIIQRKTKMVYMDITPLKKEHHLLNCHLFMGSKFQPFMCWGSGAVLIAWSRDPIFRGFWGFGCGLPFPVSVDFS